MNYLFTPAAERVLNHAAGWIDSDETLEIDTRSLLLGLLTETECRGAHILAQHDMTINEVCEVWAVPRRRLPAVKKEVVPLLHLHNDLTYALDQVYQFALEFERSPVLATEHLLLAALYSENEIAQWLISRGVNCERLEAEIRTQNGYVPAPLEIDLDLDEGSGEGCDEFMKGEGGMGNGEEETDCKLDIANCKLQIEQGQLRENNNPRSTTNDQRNPPSPFPLPPSP
jgi:ATP-dependent Clp protease ATP-binding subunit ClpA